MKDFHWRRIGAKCELLTIEGDFIVLSDVYILKMTFDFVQDYYDDSQNYS